jgi:hypothetical protein
MTLCYNDEARQIKLEQESYGKTNPKRFKVTYGLQVKAGLTYAQAAKELGECLMHALANEGKIDNWS